MEGQDMIKSLDDVETGCIVMHCGAWVGLVI